VEIDYTSIEKIIQDLERNSIESCANLYHPIPFEEFKHLTTSTNRKNAYRKWSLIEKVINSIFILPQQKLKVLDIGANAGFYSFMLAKAGADVTAFEPHIRYSKIAKFLCREKRISIDWRPQLFDFSLVKDKYFDLTLMLSVFQWIAKGGENAEEAKNTIRDISRISSYLIFELGFNRGKSCIRTKEFNHYGLLLDILRKNTRFNKFLLLGKTSPSLFSSRFMVLASCDKRYDDKGLLGYVRNLRF